MISREKCCGCSACVNVCPKNCISMTLDQEGFYFPSINESTCVHCHLCSKVCPAILCIETEKVKEYPQVYVGYNLDPEVRKESSSGGVFSAVAENVLDVGGIVYGAAMREDCYGVDQIRITDTNKLYLLRGSRYVQSNVGDTFKQAADDLKRGRLVLYTGTPCQIEGLKSYLGKDYNNLICMDFVCHGVPSEKAWQCYITMQEKKYRANAKNFFFRNKSTGWKNFSCLMYFDDGQKYIKPFEDDLWGAAFVRNANLRKSCYDCPFKKINRVSDLTVADAWGIENTNPELNDDMGYSMIFIHSIKGKNTLDNLKGKMRLKELPLVQAIAECGRLTHNSERHPTRDLFYQHIDEIPFEALVKKYAKPSLKKRVVYVLRGAELLDFTKKIVKRKKTMKMLYITTFAKSKFGSFAKSSIEAARQLGIEYHIAANETEVDQVVKDKECAELGIYHHHIDINRNPSAVGQNKRAYQQIMGLIEKYHFDVIHCNTPMGGVLGRLCGYKAGVKTVIYQAHGFHFWTGAPLKNWLCYYPIERYLAHYTDILITINKEDYGRAKKFHLKNGGKLYSVPGVGVDIKKISEQVVDRAGFREKYEIPNNGYVFLSIGEVNENKNHIVGIKAFVKANIPNSYYVICGTGEKEEVLREYIKSIGMGKKILLLGYQTGIPQILKSCDCFIFTSFREGLPGALMEAMAADLPCIATQIRGCTDLLEGSKYLFVPTDEDKLSELMNRIVEPSESSFEIERNRAAIRPYDIKAAVDELKKIYQSIVEE